MNVLKSLLLICALATSGAVLAEDASVTISSPANGAKVGTSGINVAYDVVTGPKGDHVHFYVDDKEVKVLRQLKGTYTVDSLKAGDTHCASRSSTRATRRLAWKSASRSRLAENDPDQGRVRRPPAWTCRTSGMR